MRVMALAQPSGPPNYDVDMLMPRYLAIPPSTLSFVT
jgi:hypothetical protein